ncbi:MAG: hypothetical protein ACRD1F_12850 [Terriglobales bacterium]
MARARDLADFNTAVEAAEAHNRVAIGYLRTGNVALAERALERLRAAWRQLNAEFAGKTPTVFKGDAYYGIAMTDISARLITADLMINSGHPQVAREALEAVRDDLYKLRKSAGVVVLADCIRDSSTALDALMEYDKRDLDWNNPQVRADLAAKAAGYAHALATCDALASPALRQEGEFRRLIDGAKEGLALIPKAITTSDTKLLHRVLIQLRSFDNLLEFRFG